MLEFERGKALCYQNEDVRRRPTVCLLKFVDKAFKRMLASGNLLLKKNRVLRKRQLRTAYIENHILMYKSDNIIMFSWFSLILKFTRWNAFFNRVTLISRLKRKIAKFAKLKCRENFM